jgi:hypothetical protein
MAKKNQRLRRIRHEQFQRHMTEVTFHPRINKGFELLESTSDRMKRSTQDWINRRLVLGAVKETDKPDWTTEEELKECTPKTFNNRNDPKLIYYYYII